MDGPRLRPATVQDAAACAALVRALSPAFFEHADGLGTEPFLVSVDTEHQATYISQFRYLLAEVDGQIVGLAAMRPPRHVFHLFVADDWQGRGLGQRLFDALVADSDATLPMTVNASLNAQGFYARQGFAPEGAAKAQDGVRFQPMTKPAG